MAQLRHLVKLPDASVGQLCYHYINNINSIPECVCKKPRKFKGFSKGYSAACGNRKCQQSASANTMLDRYGVANSWALEKTKIKSKKTCLEKYGAEYAIQSAEVQAKICGVNKTRYGVDYIMQSADKIKLRQSNNFAKYGVVEPIQLDSIKQKVVDTNLSKYGVKWASQLSENRVKANASRKKSEDKLIPNRTLFDTAEKCLGQYKKNPNLALLSKKYEVGHTWLSRRFRSLGIDLLV